MKLLVFFPVVLFTGALNLNRSTNFEKTQKQFPRVRQAYEVREKAILKTLQENGLPENSFNIAILAYKAESRLEIWASGSSEKPMKKIRDYEICARSGQPGPKRKEGDWQVPEGFYHIQRFNPQSRFHLALEVSYPNASDRILGTKPLGGAIMIHGACVTIGCLPMTNEVIEEIYIYAVKARQNKQSDIPVYIFPAVPDSEEYKDIIRLHSDKPNLIAFWNNIREGHQKFQRHPVPLRYSVNTQGRYVFMP